VTSTCSTTATNAVCTSCTATGPIGTLGGETDRFEEIDWSDVEVYKPVDDFG